MNDDTVWIDLSGKIHSSSARTFIDLAGKPETRDAVKRLRVFVDSVRVTRDGLLPVQRLEDGSFLCFGVVLEEDMEAMRTLRDYVAERLRGKTHRECAVIAISEEFMAFVREGCEEVQHVRA